MLSKLLEFPEVSREGCRLAILSCAGSQGTFASPLSGKLARFWRAEERGERHLRHRIPAPIVRLEFSIVLLHLLLDYTVLNNPIAVANLLSYTSLTPQT